MKVEVVLESTVAKVMIVVKFVATSWLYWLEKTAVGYDALCEDELADDSDAKELVSAE
jgi:hypothetical protein